VKTPNERRCRAARPGAPGTWCWQDTMARDLIRSRKAGPSRTSKAVVLSVYDALTEKATAESSSGFVAFQHELATLAGCSVAALKLALGQLVAAHLVRVETTPNHGPNTYSLLAPPNHPSVSHDVANRDSHHMATLHRKPKAAPPISTAPGSSPDLEPSIVLSTERISVPAVAAAPTIPESKASKASPLRACAPNSTRIPVQISPAYASTRACADPSHLNQTATPPAPSQALLDFRLILARGTFRTPDGWAAAQRLIARMSPGDLTMLSAEENAKVKALMGRR